MTGIDHRTFRYVLARFEPLYLNFTPYDKHGHIRQLTEMKRGRPRSLDAAKCLGLALIWYRTRGSCFTLCMLFGITSSVCNLFLRFARRILFRTLAKDRTSVIKLPKIQEMRTYQQDIREKYIMLPAVYAVVDGLKLYIEKSGDSVIQNMFYNGWKHDHYVGNIFVFAPSGLIFACCINAPGCMHDSKIFDWGGLYDRLEKLYEESGGQVVVESAFCSGRYPFMIKSAQDETDAEWPEEVVKMRHAT